MVSTSDYTIEELTLRIKALERIVLDQLMYQHRTRGAIVPITNVCVNTALHSRQATATDYADHPTDLRVPHYTYEPQWDWGGDFINLHPLNRPRTQDGS